MEVPAVVTPDKLPCTYGDRIPIQVQIGADSFTIKPQYPNTEMRLIEILIRVNYPDIPEDEKLFMNNWTSGPKIGQSLQPTDTVADLLLKSKKTIPTIRVCWENCPTFKVKVDLHDILVLEYHDLNIFHYVADLFDSIAADVRRKFKLKNTTRFKLQIEGGERKYRRLAFVGRYFSLQRVNFVKMMIVFEQAMTIEFIKQRSNGKYEHLICPISQIVMQEPVETICKHKFDKLPLLLAIQKNGKCPVCRHFLAAGDYKSARTLSKQIQVLRKLQINERLHEGKQKVEENDDE